jgi:hypothetical protein
MCYNHWYIRIETIGFPAWCPGNVQGSGGGGEGGEGWGIGVVVTTVFPTHSNHPYLAHNYSTGGQIGWSLHETTLSKSITWTKWLQSIFRWPFFSLLKPIFVDVKSRWSTERWCWEHWSLFGWGWSDGLLKLSERGKICKKLFSWEQIFGSFLMQEF